MSKYDMSDAKLSVPVVFDDIEMRFKKASTQHQSTVDLRALQIGVAILLADVFALVASSSIGFLTTLGLRQAVGVEYQSDYLSIQSAQAFCTLAFVVVGCSWIWGHYSKFKPVWSEFADNCKSVVYAAAIVLALLFVTKSIVSRTWFLSTLSLLLIFLPVCRQYMKSVLAKKEKWYTPLIVIGEGTNARESAYALSSDKSLGYKIAGFVSLDSTEGGGYKSKAVEVSNIVKQFQGGRLLYAPDNVSHNADATVLLDTLLTIDDKLLISFPMKRLPLNSLETLNVFRHDAMIMRAKNSLSRPIHRFVKRAFDVIASLCLLVVLSPIFIALYIAVRSDGKAALYGSKRIGIQGKEIICRKFRTMVPDSDQVLRELLASDPAAKLEWDINFKLQNDPRITKVGKLLRKSSLDELPQLLDVLSGKMSLVGPRPILLDEVSSYGDSLPLYYQTRPGITGLWQVSGRSNLSYADRIEMNTWYIKNWSLWLDIVVLLKTLPAVLNTSDAA